MKCMKGEKNKRSNKFNRHFYSHYFQFVVSIARMMETKLWFLILLTIPLLFLLNILRQLIRQYIIQRSIPGPRGYPLVGNAFDPKSLSPRDVFLHAMELYYTYGKEFRFYLGPLLFVSTFDHRDIETLISGHKNNDKSFMYSFLHPWLGTGLLTSKGEKWHRRRKLLTPTFHFKILDQFVPVFNSCGNEFIRHLAPKANGQVFKVNELVELLTLDVICETAMGVKINAQANCDATYVKAIKEVTSLTVGRMFQPWNYWTPIFFLMPEGRRYKKYVKILHDTTDKVIRERKEELKNLNITLDEDSIGLRRRVAFLDLLLLAARDGSLTDQDIREEVDTFMFEGHDTTASAVSFAIMLLSKHPDVQEKILEELQSVFASDQPLNPSVQDLGNLKYLEMVIKESLRLYPPVAFFSRYNTEDTRLVSGNVMPKGTNMSIAPLTLHQDPEVFPDPERFDPERFTPDECAKRHPFAYLPFSAGPRNCIGQKFAMLEIKSILSKVVWNYKVLPVEGFEPQITWELILKSVNGIQVRMEKRIHAS